MLSHISITVFIFRDMSRDLAKSNFHINVLQGEGKLLPTDWQVDDGIPPPQPPPLFKPLTLCSFSLTSSLLRTSFLSIIHQRSADVGEFVFTYLWLSAIEDFQVLTSQFVQNNKHSISVHYHTISIPVQDHFHTEYSTINLSHSLNFINGKFLFESCQHHSKIVTSKAFSKNNESFLVHLLKLPKWYRQDYT